MNEHLDSIIKYITEKDVPDLKKLLIIALFIYAKDIALFLKSFGKYILTLNFSSFKIAWHSVFNKAINDDDIDDIIAFDLELQRMREHFDAKTVTYSGYHNGVSEGYKSYSIRYEAARTQFDTIRHLFQNLPLAPFMGLIKQWKDKAVIAVDTTNNDTEQYQANANAQQINTNFYVVFPLIVPLKEVYPSTKPQIIMDINYNGYSGKCAIIGCISIVFDDKSHSHSNIENDVYIKERMAVCYGTYLKNPKVFCK